MKTKQTILKPFYISALSWAVRFRFVAGPKTKNLPANELHQIFKRIRNLVPKKFAGHERRVDYKNCTCRAISALVAKLHPYFSH